ncbi:hypothetical protein NFI96_032235, partial [Prochilodus magdalenae]
ETSAQTIDPLVGEVQLPEGDDLTLSCNYTSSGAQDVLQWYRQSPGFSPEFLLYINLYGSRSDPPPRMSAEVKDKKHVNLKISSAAVSDSTGFLLMKGPGPAAVIPADPPFPRLDAADSNNTVNLIISSAAVSDSVLYYCALTPTVTGNPDTLYRNPSLLNSRFHLHHVRRALH